MKLTILALIGLSSVALCHADNIVLSNLPATETFNGRFLTTTSWEAVGLTIGSSDVTFSSLTGVFRDGGAGQGLGDEGLSGDIQAPPSASIDGGIFSDASGHPGTELTGASFTTQND